MLARFNGNVVPFANDATSTNRTVFGGTTQSDTLDDNLNADFKKGWEIVGLNDNPTREDFNAMGYTLGALNAYLYEMGIAEWNASQNYRINSRVIGSDGKIYKALTGTIGTPNINHNPVSDTVNWEWELKTITDYSALTSKTTPVDADLLALGDSTSSFSLKKLTWANLKTVLFGSPALTGTPTAPTAPNGTNSAQIATTAFVANLNSANVKLTGDQTIAGVKTFSSSPIVPTPTTGTQAVNKDYADLKVALSDFIGTNQNLSGSGYQKLSGGLIIQWGTGTTIPASGTSTTTFPIAFPNSCFYVTCIGQGYSQGIPEVVSKTTTSVVFGAGSNAQLTTPLFFAIGY